MHKFGWGGGGRRTALYNDFKAGCNYVIHTSAFFIAAFYLHQIIHDQNKITVLKLNTYYLRYFMILVLPEVYTRSDATLFPSSDVWSMQTWTVRRGQHLIISVENGDLGLRGIGHRVVTNNQM
jgi:hypothetical protein